MNRSTTGFVGVILLAVAVIGLFLLLPESHCQALPDAPRAQQPRPKWDFYVSNGAMWASVIADERISARDIRRGCAAEGNARYALPGGRINSRKYYAENASLAAGLTAVSYIVHRYAPRSMEARIIAAGLTASVTVRHSIAVGQWVGVCHE